MQSTEEGLQQVDELVQTYKHSCSWFLGPFYHLVRLFHPDYVKPLLMAPGGKSTLYLCTVMRKDAFVTLVSFFFYPANITVKDELIYGHLRPWLGESKAFSHFSSSSLLVKTHPHLSLSVSFLSQERVCC